MKNEKRIKKWIAHVTNDATLRDIAARTGTSPATLSRWIKTNDTQLTPTIATAYNTNPLPGLIAQKTITEKDIWEYSEQAQANLHDYSDLALARELLRRLQHNPDQHLELKKMEFYNGDNI